MTSDRQICLKLIIIIVIIAIEILILSSNFALIIENIGLIYQENIALKELNHTIPLIINEISDEFRSSGVIRQNQYRGILQALNQNYNISRLEQKFEEYVPKNLTEKIFQLIFSKFYVKNKTLVGHIQ